QKGVVTNNAPRNRSTAMWRLQRQELLHDQEQEDDHGSSGVQQVLPQVPQAYFSQRSEIGVRLEDYRGVSSTAKLPVSKTGLGGSNPSAPARDRLKRPRAARSENRYGEAGSDDSRRE